MSTLRILHSADFHLDSPFEGLSSDKAAIKRAEQRELLGKLAALVSDHGLYMVLLSGDLLDGGSIYKETAEDLLRCLGGITVPVFIAPGNHDFYSPASVYARLTFPDNVHIFKRNTIECVELPELKARVFGAAFTSSSSRPLLNGFHAEHKDGYKNIMCIHGEVSSSDNGYNSISLREIADSGLDYLALGHIHKASGLLKSGETFYSQPGCPEGRGFDEAGIKTVSIVELSDTGCTLRQETISGRRYETLRVDVSDTDPLLALHSAVPDDSMPDIYRITLIGTPDSPPDLDRLYANLSDFFFSVELRDATRQRRPFWDGCGDDSLRGLFLSKMKNRFDTAGSEERALIEQAVRWGLAAIDNYEEVARHDNQ